MLFQMCYGPEIEVIYENLRTNPGLDLKKLKAKFQHVDSGDITSLIECGLTVLEDLQFVYKDKCKYFVLQDKPWCNKEVLLKLRKLSISEDLPSDSLDKIFASLFEQLFVKPDRLFVSNIHYQINSQLMKTLVGHEKVNAWKRMMECWGLGRRIYSGFYALPQLSLMKSIIKGNEAWEGGLHPFCENIIHPVIPCLTAEGNIYRGVIFSLMALHQEGVLELSYMQDLHYKSYGPKNELNWIKVERRCDLNDALSQQKFA
ncbi:hypothetical protein PVOR_07280 [Paenibacillus vortex V453]|jgi:hypothetical protein|uniref:Uncharacterized protein n=1 Tax=Paenibacillus vortex V453 TaxID=715225 RepID=A0A2R9SZ02_9BACL|nr:MULTISPECIES: hypothetical protein [Paenibacillus]ANA81029.1 hypothetical protein A3958_14070 [Paenibacillus glucanolyticus]AVV54851.1 hypothetical protein C7121_01145 [Paenibacillus glucanolyticus]EFU42639.1 hypothetical protein PVOR_07280 [Paenibacillus vortex V453]ETT36406.1 hypothetical protein C169_14279 [Paenibacillus sp. FSL R5-808]MDH6674139.1 hypothetical protein [Paenibacillus sp. LBL]